MKISALRFLFCAFVATALSLTASAQTAAGSIKAAKVQGQVLKLAVDGTSTPLKDGEELTETDTVTTGKGASVVLVFMNGSSVKLGAESRLGIDEFKMDPLDAPINASTLTAEPTKSQTKLNLAYGEMVGDVKKLNTSSNYSIKTPVGAAGIRGTIYRIVFRPSADGKAFFTVSTQEGKVVMEGVTTLEIPVDAGKEVVVEVDTNNPANPTFVTQDLAPATVAAFAAAATTISEVIATAVITPPTPPAAPPTPPSTPLAPPEPTPPAPPLTPGAGG